MRIIALAIALAASPLFSAAAQTTAAAQGAGRSGGMTLDQFQARQRERLMRADTNHDGRISLAEWTAWQAAHPARNGGGDASRLFQRLDANHDGFVTPDEIDALSARRFAHMDADHDGTLSPDERSAMRGRGEGPAEPVAPR